jgi:PEP-CTERM motif
MKSGLSLLIFGCALCAIPATAGVIFSDDFSADGNGLAKTTLSKWNVLSGSNVDVGAFGALCGPSPAQCIDTQGSGGNSNADIQWKLTFSANPALTYDFHFTLNNGGGTNSFLLTIGSFSTTISSATSPDNTYDLIFTLTANPTATIRITDQGPADNVGLYLGHIQLSDNSTAAVPEPGTLTITALAGGLLFVIRRKMARN